MVARRLVVYKKNPNYSGDRPQPFDNIAIHNQVAPDVALGRVESGQLDAVMFDPGDTLSGAQSDLAAEWGPNGPHAASGDQRWFGAARSWVNYISLNPTGPTLRDPATRHAVALAIDRAELAGVFVEQPTQELLIPTVQGANLAPVAPQPDLDAARQLLGNQPVKVTMLGIPDEWGWDDGTDIEKALISELAKVGITVDVQKGNPDDFFGHGVLDAGSKVDIAWNRSTGVDYSDPVASLGDLADVGLAGQDQPGRTGETEHADRPGPHRWSCGLR